MKYIKWVEFNRHLLFSSAFAALFVYCTFIREESSDIEISTIASFCLMSLSYMCFLQWQAHTYILSLRKALAASTLALSVMLDMANMVHREPKE